MTSTEEPRSKGFKGRFDDDRTISANIQSIGDPNRKSKLDHNAPAPPKKESTFSRNSSSPFRNIFKN